MKVKYFSVDELPLIQLKAELEGVDVSEGEPGDSQAIYGASLHSYWWHLSAGERQDKWVPLSVDEQWGEQFTRLTPDFYVPGELALCMAHTLIHDLEYPYVGQMQSVRTGAISTAEVLDMAFLDLCEGGDNMGLNAAMEVYKNDREQFKARAHWMINLIERRDGESEFTHRARLVVEGLRDFAVTAYLAHKMLQDERGLKLPHAPLDLPPSKTKDIPGQWQVRRITPYYGYHGQGNYVICADEHGFGVAFSMAPEKVAGLGLKPGKTIGLRAGVKGLDVSEKYLRLERVQIRD